MLSAASVSRLGFTHSIEVSVHNTRGLDDTNEHVEYDINNTGVAFDNLHRSTSFVCIGTQTLKTAILSWLQNDGFSKDQLKGNNFHRLFNQML